MDDFFWGPKNTGVGLKTEKRNADLLFEHLITVGELTGAKMNLEKCCPPARIMEILGFIYDAIARSCRLSEKKRTKYVNRINDVLRSPNVTFKNLEKLVGNLTYAAWVAPFGRPFLSVLSGALKNQKEKKLILVTSSMRNA